METIKYYKPKWDIGIIDIGDPLVFRWDIEWKVVGKTKSGYLKLSKVRKE